MDDFISVSLSSISNDAWIPPEFILQLKPQQGLSQDEVHAKTALRIKFCLNYPHKQPSIRLENSQGVSSKDIEQLQKELQDLCTSKEGEEVVFILAHHTQVYQFSSIHPASW